MPLHGHSSRCWSRRVLALAIPPIAHRPLVPNSGSQTPATAQEMPCTQELGFCSGHEPCGKCPRNWNGARSLLLTDVLLPLAFVKDGHSDEPRRSRNQPRTRAPSLSHKRNAQRVKASFKPRSPSHFFMGLLIRRLLRHVFQIQSRILTPYR